MRTKNSIRNVSLGLISQFVLVVIGFILRKVFIDILGSELLGINSLFISIIAMLSLTELGIGTAIICNLYKPLADGEEKKVAALILFFKRTYLIIASIILVLGLLAAPFLSFFISASIEPMYLAAIFFLILADTIITYLFAHKRSLISADQNNYIVVLVNALCSIILSIFQIAVLILTRNYILFLCLRLVIRLLESIIIIKIANTKYPYIKSKENNVIDKETKNSIILNTKALALHYVGKYLISGTDSIIISKFLGVAIVGIYSNYLLIVETLRKVLGQFSIGVLASFGNMVVKEDSAKSHEVFKKANFLNFVFYNFAAVSFICLINPFIRLWIGEEYLLAFPVVAVLSLNFYITGITEVLGTIRASAGIFRPDRYLHLIMAVLNLIISIILVRIIGIIGVFIGTLVCLIIKEISVLPSIVYKNILKSHVAEFYIMLWGYVTTTIVSAAVALLISEYFIITQTIWMFFIRCFVCIAIPNLIVLIFYRKTEEFIYAWEYITKVILARFKKEKIK